MGPKNAISHKFPGSADAGVIGLHCEDHGPNLTLNELNPYILNGNTDRYQFVIIPWH